MPRMFEVLDKESKRALNEAQGQARKRERDRRAKAEQEYREGYALREGTRR